MSNLMFDFSEKNYIVTGATAGIGRQVTLSLAAAGAKVLAVARRGDLLKEVAEYYPKNIEAAPIDICDYINLETAIIDFVNKNGKLNGAVNCAGKSSLIPLNLLDIEQAKKIMELNFWAAMNLAHIVFKTKYSAKGSSIVFISSIAAHRGVKGKYAYAASKAALIAAVKCFAKEVALKGNRINTISPGWIAGTEMTDVAKKGISDESFINMCDNYPLGLGDCGSISDMCLYLLSENAKWITGSDFVVDGGHLA